MATEVAIPDYCKMENDLEQQELDSAGGVASAQIYGQLLALYLLHNETCNAKFLWKRIPQAVKSTNPELSNIWNIGQKLWQRDYPGIYEGLKKEWSESIKAIMDALLAVTRKRAGTLVSQAYSSIKAEELASFLGMTADEAVEAVTAEGWEVTVDLNVRHIKPKKLEPPKEPVLLSEDQLSVLTDYVSFLES